MSKTGLIKKLKPAFPKGVPVLIILYSLLFLALLAMGGWLFWSDLEKDKTSLSAAVTEIAPPVPEAKKHAPEHAESAEDTPTEQSENEEEPHTDQKQEDARPDPHAQEVKEETSAATEVKSEKDHKEISEAKLAEDVTPPIENPTGMPSKAEIPVAEEKSPVPIEPVAEEKKSPTAPQGHEAQAIGEAETPEPEKHAAIEDAPPPVQAPVKKQEKIQTKLVTAPEQAFALSIVPDPELTKNSDFGLLPVIGPTGRKPWQIYARPFDDPLNRPRIAIIIGEMGMSNSATKSTIQNLQGAVTLSFNPYARDLQSWIEQARAAGHEVLLQLPMEPFGYPQNDPGPQSLMTNLTDRENLNRLNWMLSRFTGYSGVTNQMGSKFTATAEDIQPILDVVKSRGLLFLDGRTSARSVAGQLAAKSGVPVAINNRFLDHKANRTTIDARLKELERIARSTGTAVGIGYPYPVTLERINKWAQTLARKGFVLVPVSAAIDRQEIQ